MKARIPPSREAAEMLAVQALAYLAGEPERIAAFVAVTGIDLPAIREAAKEPGFLAGVLEHMLGDETLLIAFAESAGIDPADIVRARNALGGRKWDRDLP